MRYRKLIWIWEDDEDASNYLGGVSAHANVNKDVFLSKEKEIGGAGYYQRRLKFKLPYSKELSKIATNPQLWFIEYEDNKYNIIDYDDYMERHKEITLTGVLYE